MRALLRRSHLAVVLALAGLLPGSLQAQDDPGAHDPDAVRLSELYIPYDRFVEIAGDHPDGLIIDLAEYRDLVRRAAAVPTPEEPTLPPVDSSIIRSHSVVRVDGVHARVEQIITIRVMRDGWVRCPLGESIPGLGSVRVVTATGTDTPGWIVREGGRSDLLLHGRGEHTVRLLSSVRVDEAGTGSVLTAPVVRAPAGTLRLEIPGRARLSPSTAVRSTEGSGDPLPLEVLPEGTDDRRTVFVGSIGARERIQVAWERERVLDANPILLTSAAQLRILARREDPRFVADFTVGIARRATDTLRFTIPANFTVVGVEHLDGAKVHAWSVEGDTLTVRAAAPRTGTVMLRIDGAIEGAVGSVDHAPLRLVGAESEFGEILVYARPHDTVVRTASVGLTPLDPSEARGAVTFPARTGAPTRTWDAPISRHAFTRAEARATVTVTEDPVSVSLRQTYLVHEDLERRRLHGALEWRVESGRAREVTLALPSGWRIVDLRPIGPEIPLRVEDFFAEGRTILRLVPENALDRDRPLDLHIVLEPEEHPVDLAIGGEQGSAADSAPTVRPAQFALPVPLDATLRRTDLGLVLADTLVLSETALGRWTALPEEEIPALTTSEAGTRIASLGARLVAAVTTPDTAPVVAYTARRLPPQGDVRSVTHLLAAERGTGDGGHAIRIRTDLQVVVLDHAIDRVTIEHPRFPGDPAIHILGDGVREVVPDPNGTRHVVRFVRPWIGARLLRLETEFSATPGTAIPFPEIGLGDRFGGPRALVVQSQGSVEISIDPGPGLARMALDDLPDFAEPWASGRVLQAFRHRRAGTGDAASASGTFTTTVHRRAPVLTQLAQRLDLETVLGADLSSRTRATLLLSSAREQTLRVDIPEDAQVLSVTIDGDPIGHVRADTGAGTVPDGFRRIAIPLPPRSHASVTILTERTRPGGVGALGVRDPWRTRGLRLVDGPVGETHWVVYHPEGWHAAAGRGGNLVPLDGEVPTGTYFARRFFGALFSGHLPRFGVFAAVEPPRGAIEGPTPLTEEEAAGALAQREGSSGELSPRGKDDPFADRDDAVCPAFAPSGREIRLTKFGGSPDLELLLSDPARERGRARIVFAATLLLCFLLRRARWNRDLYLLIGGGLFLGTFLPPAIGWSSPMLAIPFCEALVVAALLLGAGRLLRAVTGWVARRRHERDGAIDGVLATGLLPFLLGALLLGAIDAPLGAQEGRIVHAPAGEEPVLPPPFDTVLIPYPTDAPPWEAGSPEPKVYLSHERFRELWRIVHPEETPVVDLVPAGVTLAIGDARHSFRIDGDRFRIRAEARVRTFPDRTPRNASEDAAVTEAPVTEAPVTEAPVTWRTLPIPTHHARLERVIVDGVDAGFTRGSNGIEVALRGVGVHTVVVEWIGTIDRDRGIFSAQLPLFPAPGNRIEGTLPPGAELIVDRSHPSLVVESASDGPDAPVPFRADLGAGTTAWLVWTFPRIEGDLATQISSASATTIHAMEDRLAIERIESVRATGRPVERVRYRVRGGLEVIAVRGEGLDEWSLLPADGDDPDPVLEVTFTAAVERAAFRIDAIRALPLDGSESALPTLTLEGAVRQESFIGIRHGDRVRFTPTSLQELPRASTSEVAARFSIDLTGVDRVHHAHGDARTARFAVTAPARRVRVETDAIARVTARGLSTFFRVRYLEAKGAALSLDIPLPLEGRVARVVAPMLRRHEVFDGAGGRVLRLTFDRRPIASDTIVWSIAPPDPTGGSSPLPEAIELPFLSLGSAVDEESLTWTVVGERGIDLTTPPTAGWEMIPPDRAPVWIAVPSRDSTRFALRSQRTGPRGAIPIAVRPRASLLRGTVASFAHLGEEWLTVHSRIVPEVRFLGRDTFTLLLPAGAEVVELVVRDERERVVTPLGDGSGRTRVTVRLLSPVTGTVTLDLVHRVARDLAASGAGAEGPAPIVVSPVQLLGDAGTPLAEVERFVGLVRPGASTDATWTPDGLAPIDRERVPFLPDGIGPDAIRATWTAMRPDWSLTIREGEVTIAEGLAAVIPLLDLSTRIGADGTLRTEASFTLHNERLQFLTVDLPEGAILWGVTVDGNPVAVASESGAAGAAGASNRVRVPVDPAVGAELAREIVLTYEEPPVDLPSWTTRTDLAGPTVVDADVRVVQSIWTVRFPHGYTVEETAGRMRQTPPSARYAERLSQLMDQQETILEATKKLDSRRERQRAAQQLARIEQQLGDSLVGLSQFHRSTGEMSQSAMLGAGTIDAQNRENAQIKARTAQARAEIRAALDAESERTATASPEDRAFQDRVRFLHGKWWRDGRLAAARGGTVPTSGGVLSPTELLSSSRYRGWGGLIPLVPGGGVDVVDPAPIDPTGGLPPLPDGARLRTASNLPPASLDDGRTTYTFRGAGDPRLRLAFRRDGAGLKWWSWGVLVVAAGAAWLLTRREPRQLAS